MEIIETKIFTKQIKGLLSNEQYREFKLVTNTKLRSKILYNILFLNNPIGIECFGY